MQRAHLVDVEALVDDLRHRIPEQIPERLHVGAPVGVIVGVGVVADLVDGADAQFETNSPLSMRGGMTIDVFILKGIFKQPGALTKLVWFMGGNPVVFLPLVTLAVMFTLWWYKGRDPDPGESVAPMYAPPAGISPAEAGTLLDDTIHPRDITSTIVDNRSLQFSFKLNF